MYMCFAAELKLFWFQVFVSSLTLEKKDELLIDLLSKERS